MTDVETAKTSKDYSVSYNTSVFTDIDVVDDISKVDKDAWVFAIVDDIKQLTEGETANVADKYGSGKAAIGKADYFTGSKAYKEGRQIVFHEVLHLLGANDTYPPNGGLPGTQNDNNAMYYASPNNKRQLTSEQVVKEIMSRTIGTVKYLFGPGVYQQPLHSSTAPTQDALKNFINKYGSATKLAQ